MSYVFELTDRLGNAVSGLPGARDRNFAVNVNSFMSGKFNVRQNHANADFLLACDGLVKVYEEDFNLWPTRQLRAHGRLISAEENSQGGVGTIACTFADPFWMLARRLIGKTATGYSMGTALAPVDRGAIIQDMINTTNAEGETGLRVGTVTASSSTYLTQVRFTKIAQQIALLSAVLDGPDWIINPIEWVGGKFGEIVVAPSISSYQPDAAFESGGSSKLNVDGYSRVVTLDGLMNQGFHLPPGFPDNATQAVLSQKDDASIAQYQLMEDIVSADLSVDALRLALLQQNIAVRKGPRQTITFTPTKDIGTGKIPRLAVDYNVGDVVPFRASVLMDDNTWDSRADVAIRIYQVAMAIDDDSGLATPSFTVAPN